MGKTRLAAELRAVHDLGVTVLAGRCDEDLGVPYQPFVEALRHFVDHVPTEELAGRLGRYGGRAGPAGTGGGGRSRPRPASAFRPRDRAVPALRRGGRLAGRRLARGAHPPRARRPPVGGRADAAPAASPGVAESRATRLLVVGTYRDTELWHDHPLVEVLADLRRQEGVERFSLTGLDQSGVARFMEQRMGHDLADEELPLARAIYQETEGNPFFVREVLRHLAETSNPSTGRSRSSESPRGFARWWAGGWPGSPRTPTTCCGVASVVGTEFEVTVLQEAERPRRRTLLSALEEASRPRLIDRCAREPLPLRPQPGPPHPLRELVGRPPGPAPPPGGGGHRVGARPAPRRAHARPRPSLGPGGRAEGRDGAGRRLRRSGRATWRRLSSPITRPPPTTAKGSSCWKPEAATTPSGPNSSCCWARRSTGWATPATAPPSWRAPVWPSASATPTASPGPPWPVTGGCGAGASVSTGSGWPPWRPPCEPGRADDISSGPGSSPTSPSS